MNEKITIYGYPIYVTSNEAKVELPITWEDVEERFKFYVIGKDIVQIMKSLLSPKAEKEVSKAQYCCCSQAGTSQLCPIHGKKAEKEDLMTGRCERCGSALIPEKPLPKEKIEELPMLFPGEEIAKSEEVAAIILLADRIQKLIRHCNGEKP